MHFHNSCVIGGILTVILCTSGMVAIQAQSNDAAQVREERISIDVQDKPFSDIIEGIKDQTKENIVYKEDELSDVSVTIRLVDVTWKAALKTIAEQYKCLVEENEYAIITVSKPPRVTMELEGADIRDVINYIAQVANENIVLSEQVEGKVSLRLKDVPWHDALDTIIKNSGYVLVQEKGDIFRVVPPREIQAQLETEVFQLRYVRPKSGYVAKMSGATTFFEQPATAAMSLQSMAQQGAGQAIQVSQFSLLTALQAVVTPERGTITYDETTNTLVITDTKPKIDKVKEIVQKLDREPKQIFVDVKFVRTTNTDLFNFGVEVGPEGVRVSQTLGSLTTRFPFSLGRSGFEEAIAAAPKDAVLPSTGSFPVDSDGNPSGGIQFGRLNFNDTIFTLRLLKRDIKSKIVQAPKLITMDHHEATLFVGRSVAFPQAVILQNDNGTTSVQLVEASRSPAQDGFQILLIPHILPDTNKIQMTLIIANEQLTGATALGFNHFELAGTSIDLPETTSQVVVTHMILETGQTAVLGGLLQINQSETVNKVPFFGDIPFLGYFFKHKQIQKSKQDLFIFLTPRIVQSAEATKDRQKATIQEESDRHTATYNTIWAPPESKQEKPPQTLPGDNR